MKLQMKLAAVAAALVAAAGSAHADLTLPGTNNGSLALVAFNQLTRAYYIRDLGYFMNDFLPSSVTTLSGDGSVIGNKTPEAGLTLNKVSNANFSDSAAWGTWINGQNTSDIRWMVSSVDANGTSTTTNVKRVITTLATVPPLVSNGNVDGYIASGAAGGLGTLANPLTGISFSSPNSAPTYFDNNFGLGGAGALATLDQGVGLYYFARSVGTLSNPVAATQVQYGNSLNFASIKLAANGDFSYTLAPAAAVPLPAAVWLMGAGLMAVGGVVRRRKAAAQA
jgi:hypothetical protein